MNYFLPSSQWPLKYLVITAILIKALGVFIALFIFAKWSPLIDSNLYLQNAMSMDSAFRTRAVNNTAVFLNAIGGHYFAHFIFSLFSIAGILYYFLTGGRRWLVLAFLLFPSSLVWTSIVGKEALFFGASGIILVIWSKYLVEKISIWDYLFLVFSFVICMMLRPHYAIAFCWLFFSAYLLKNFKRNAYKLLILSIIILSVIIYITSWEPLLLRGFGGIDSMARSSRFASLEIDPFTGAGYVRYVSLVWYGLIWGVIGPLPSELIGRPEFIPFFAEGVIIFLMPFIVTIICLSINLVNKNSFFKVFLFSLLPAIAILLFMHSPFGVLNPGSAIRWRVNFEQAFYLAPVLLIFRFMDATKKENSPLSS